MLSKTLQDAINTQLNKELSSEYIYLGMASYTKGLDLDGFSNFFTVQVQEERFHAMKFYTFLLDRGANVILKEIPAPDGNYKNVIDVFEKTLAHEQFITKSINELMDLAVKENDHALISFLKWFVDEQVEEEANVSRILNRLKLIGGEGQGLLMIDAELATRTFTPPVETGA
jgi:ferritin